MFFWSSGFGCPGAPENGRTRRTAFFRSSVRLPRYWRCSSPSLQVTVISSSLVISCGTVVARSWGWCHYSPGWLSHSGWKTTGTKKHQGNQPGVLWRLASWEYSLCVCSLHHTCNRHFTCISTIYIDYTVYITHQVWFASARFLWIAWMSTKPVNFKKKTTFVSASLFITDPRSTLKIKMHQNTRC